jgi:hypothetical protein
MLWLILCNVTTYVCVCVCVCVFFPVCCDICGHDNYKCFLLAKCMINLYNIVAHEKYDSY